MTYITSQKLMFTTTFNFLYLQKCVYPSLIKIKNQQKIHKKYNAYETLVSIINFKLNSKK